MSESEIGNEKAQGQQEAKQQPETGTSTHVEGPGWKMERKPEEAEGKAAGEKARAQELPEVDFSRFCLFLASSALISLGESPHPETNAAEVNLPQAHQTIDILAMLEEKTKGNLTDEEAKLISAILYDLRMRFLQKSRE